MLQIGDSYQEEITFTQEMEQKFIELTGDNNLIHTDANAALSKGGVSFAGCSWNVGGVYVW